MQHKKNHKGIIKCKSLTFHKVITFHYNIKIIYFNAIHLLSINDYVPFNANPKMIPFHYIISTIALTLPRYKTMPN